MLDPRGVLVVLVVCATAIAGCGGSSQGSTNSEPPPADRTEPAPSLPRQTIERARCPQDYPGCRSTVGRIIYVERHDPDGDGDAHFVVLDAQGITYRGITAIDVEASLRPTPLPGVGDLISAAGPVQTGSFGQEQIHALVLEVGTPAGPES